MISRLLTKSPVIAIAGEMLVLCHEAILVPARGREPDGGVDGGRKSTYGAGGLELLERVGHFERFDLRVSRKRKMNFLSKDCDEKEEADKKMGERRKKNG